MGKRFWSLALSMALIAGVFSIVPAKAAGGEIKFFLASTGCSAADVNFDFLTVTDADSEIECNYTGAGIRNEIGSNTGTVGANGSNAVADRETATRYWDSTDGGKVTLDASRPITGDIYTMGAHCVVTGQPCSPAGASLGQVVLDIEVVGYVGDAETSFGTQTDTFQVAPGAAHKTAVSIQPEAALTGKTFDRVELRTWVHGPSAGHGVIKTNGDVSSFISVPTASAVVSDPGTPAKPKPTTGKDCGKGKSKGEGKGPKDCPTKPKPGKPKPPKGPKPAPGCTPYAPGEEGKDAGPAVLVTDAATAEKPVETTIDIHEGIGVGGVFEDAMSHAFKNVQVDPAAASTGLYVRLEMPAHADYDLYVNNPDGSMAARAAGFNPEPAVYNDTEAGGHTETGAEVIEGLTSTDCQGYTVRTSAASAEGGTLTLKFWLGEAKYAAGGGESAADMFFSMAKMANPLKAKSVDQAGGTPAAEKGCKKGKGKKKGCTKPPVGCAPFTPGEAGKDKPTVILTDAATEAAPVEQKVNLAASLGDARQGPMPAAGPFAESYDYFNVQVDSASPNTGLYVLFEFPERRDYDLEMLHLDGSYAARSHDFNPVCGVPGLSCANEGVGGEAGTNYEKLVGINTTDCGGWTIEAVNWLGEGGEMTVKMWLGEVVNEPQAPGTEPHA